MQSPQEQDKGIEWEKEFFDRFGANKIWVTPSKDNVETILEIWSFIHKELAAQRVEAFREGREKELEILRVHLDRQVMERSVNTASLYEYINSGLQALYPEGKLEE